jgi:hypothetical protein
MREMGRHQALELVEYDDLVQGTDEGGRRPADRAYIQEVARTLDRLVCDQDSRDLLNAGQIGWLRDRLRTWELLLADQARIRRQQGGQSA